MPHRHRRRARQIHGTGLKARAGYADAGRTRTESTADLSAKCGAASGPGHRIGKHGNDARHGRQAPTSCPRPARARANASTPMPRSAPVNSPTIAPRKAPGATIGPTREQVRQRRAQSTHLNDRAVSRPASIAAHKVEPAAREARRPEHERHEGGVIGYRQGGQNVLRTGVQAPEKTRRIGPVATNGRQKSAGPEP